MKKYFSCIIPFHNEGESVLSVLGVVRKVREINQIIAVDDGSTDTIWQLIKNKFPGVSLIRLSDNLGKAAAVKAGLGRATFENIFLIDADLVGLNPQELKDGLKKFLKGNLDMLIFQIFTTKAKLDGWLNKYITFSGTRIIKKHDLDKVLRERPKGYQLETAINEYFIRNKKRVAWIKCSAINPNKLEKIGVRRGLIRNIKMELAIIAYTGLRRHLKQLFTFARKEAE